MNIGKLDRIELINTSLPATDNNLPFHQLTPVVLSHHQQMCRYSAWYSCNNQYIYLSKANQSPKKVLAYLLEYGFHLNHVHVWVHGCRRSEEMQFLLPSITIRLDHLLFWSRFIIQDSMCKRFIHTRQLTILRLKYETNNLEYLHARIHRGRLACTYSQGDCACLHVCEHLHLYCVSKKKKLT